MSLVDAGGMLGSRVQPVVVRTVLGVRACVGTLPDCGCVCVREERVELRSEE